jgi:biotin carboxyl carrier protein
MSYEPPDQPGVLGAVDGKKPAHTTTNAGGLASPAPTASAATSHAATKAVPHHVIATFTGRVGMQLVDEGDRITVIFAETLVRVSGRPAVSA